MNFIHKLTSVSFIAYLCISPILSPIHAQPSNTLDISSTERVHTIVLDAGHGGKDPGAVQGKTYEKDITLSVTLKVGELIAQNLPNVNIIYTRKDDQFIPLHQRSEIANQKNADLFISIHCNVFPKDGSKKGSETYVMGLHKIQSNLAVSKRENAVIGLEQNTGKYYNFDINSPEGHIFLSTYQNAYLDRSVQFADYVERHLKKEKKLPSRGVKQAGFHVLSNTTMPSVLIETGFITNAEEKRLLVSLSGQQIVAHSIVQAILDYKNWIEKTNIQMAQNDVSKPIVSVKKDISTKATIQYTIQIAASSNQHNSKYTHIPDCKVQAENKLYKYQVGRYEDFTQAEKRRKLLIGQGFKDAFIVAYKREKRVTLPLKN